MSVSAKKDVIIKDACILFDLMDLGLLGHFYQLQLTVITTPEVLAEITDAAQLSEIQPYIDNGYLQIDSFGLFETVRAIVDTNRGLSFTDAAVLEVAMRRKAAILSSDKSLRNESTRRGLTVKGLLWVLEELYNHKIISVEMVIEKLVLYPEVNIRAPKKEIENLVIKLTKTEKKQTADPLDSMGSKM